MRYVFFISCVLSVLCFSGCSKMDGLDTPNSDIENGLTSVALFNAVANSTAMDVYLDDKKLNASSGSFVAGGYIPNRTLSSGNKNLNLLSRSKDGEERYEGSVMLYPNTFSSLFIYRDQKLSYVQTVDNMIKPAVGMSKIRFAHMSSDAQALAVYTEEQLLEKSVSFKDVTPFIEVRSAKDFNLNMKSVSEQAVPELSGNFNLENQQIYTLLLFGSTKVDGEGKLVVKLVKH